MGAVAVSVATGWDCWGVGAGVCWAALGLLGGAAGAARRTGALGANFLPDLSAETEESDDCAGVEIKIEIVRCKRILTDDRAGESLHLYMARWVTNRRRAIEKKKV